MVHLEPFGGHVGLCWRILATRWAMLGHLGAMLRHLGDKMRPKSAKMSPRWRPRPPRGAKRSEKPSQLEPRGVRSYRPARHPPPNHPPTSAKASGFACSATSLALFALFPSSWTYLFLGSWILVFWSGFGRLGPRIWVLIVL